MGVTRLLAQDRAQAEARAALEPGVADPSIIERDLLALTVFQE